MAAEYRPDIKTEYRKWNNKLFDGELPTNLRFRWSKSKKWGGVTKSSRGPDGSYNVKEIAISMFIKMEEERFSRILIHEMVHVYIRHNGIPDKNHGPNFRSKAKEVGAKAGIKIPLFDETVGMDISEDIATKKFGVAIIHHPRGDGLTVYPLKSFHRDMNKLVDKFEVLVSRYSGKAEVTLVESDERELLQLPLSRTTSRSYSWTPASSDLMRAVSSGKLIKNIEYSEDSEPLIRFVRNSSQERKMEFRQRIAQALTEVARSLVARKLSFGIDESKLEKAVEDYVDDYLYDQGNMFGNFDYKYSWYGADPDVGVGSGVEFEDFEFDTTNPDPISLKVFLKSIIRQLSKVQRDVNITPERFAADPKLMKVLNKILKEKFSLLKNATTYVYGESNTGKVETDTESDFQQVGPFIRGGKVVFNYTFTQSGKSDLEDMLDKDPETWAEVEERDDGDAAYDRWKDGD